MEKHVEKYFTSSQLLRLIGQKEVNRLRLQKAEYFVDFEPDPGLSKKEQEQFDEMVSNIKGTETYFVHCLCNEDGWWVTRLY